MARIRTIKPDFWTDEKLTECSLSARLLFIGTWNFADDNGNLDRSSKQIKARVFPIDNIDCEPLIQELIKQGLLIEYSVSDKKYLHIQGFSKHQVINRPSKPTCPLMEHSVSSPAPLKTEGKGMEEEGNGRDINTSSQQAGNVHNLPVCPHQEIIALYAKNLPMGIQPKVWNETRQSALKARWREDVKRQSLEWWDRLFAHIAKSDFLTGKVSSRDNRAFEISLDWICKAENFLKIIEGKYDNKVVAHG